MHLNFYYYRGVHAALNFFLGAVLRREPHIATTYYKCERSKCWNFSPMSAPAAIDYTTTNYFKTDLLSPMSVPAAITTNYFKTSLFSPMSSASMPVASVVPETKKLKTKKTYKCPKCGKYLSHRSTLDRHSRTVCSKIRNPTAKWRCGRCNKGYASRGSLTRHKEYECGRKKKFACIVCDKDFTQRCSLKRHLYTQHSKINVSDAQLKLIGSSKQINKNVASESITIRPRRDRARQ